MKVQHLTTGAFQSECYFVMDTSVWIVDPGDEADAIRTGLKSSRLPVSAYLLTHGHADHLSALASLLETHPAPVYLHERDSAWAFSALNQIPPYYQPPDSVPEELTSITDGQTLLLDGIKVHVIGTPGHTPGSVCYHLPANDILFTGDTLFHGSVGRTDLPGGNGRELQASLEQLAVLPSETLIYPGHGPSTTLAEQLLINPYMRG